VIDFVKTRRLGVSWAASVLVLMAGVVTSASAFVESGITGSVSDFTNCPVPIISVSNRNSCVHSYTRGGSVKIGHATVPISAPGDTFDFGEYKESIAPCGLREPTGCVIAPPHEVLSGPAQPVPGGALGTIGNAQITGVSAKLEWVTSPPPNTSFGTFFETCPVSPLELPLVTYDECRITGGRNGTGVTLRVRIHLLSPFLGSSCYIGTLANPIVIPLTVGITNPPPPASPIHGKPAEAVHNRGGVFLEALGVTLVSNSFAVPAANGCGTTGGGLINAAINQKVGLPSPAGQNAMVVNADAEISGAQNLLEHGWTGE
jgi:hypothetical protein